MIRNVKCVVNKLENIVTMEEKYVLVVEHFLEELSKINIMKYLLAKHLKIVKLICWLAEVVSFVVFKNVSKLEWKFLGFYQMEKEIENLTNWSKVKSDPIQVSATTYLLLVSAKIRYLFKKLYFWNLEPLTEEPQSTIPKIISPPQLSLEEAMFLGTLVKDLGHR